MIVLGINAAYHESAASIVRDGRVLLAVEEERLSRVKHAKRARVDNPDELPWRAIDLCLAAAGLALRDMDAVGYSLVPGERLALAGSDPYPLLDPAGWGSLAGETEFDRRVRAVPALLAERAGSGALAERVRFVPHHLCHAALAYHGSPFESAAALVIDGVGERATAWLGRGEGARLEVLEEVPYPHSLGMLWERVSLWLGFDEHDAGKAMGLAAFGDPERHRGIMERILHVPDLGGGELGRGLPFEIDASSFDFAAGSRPSRTPSAAVARASPSSARRASLTSRRRCRGARRRPSSPRRAASRGRRVSAGWSTPAVWH